MFNVRLAGGHLYGKQLFTWLSLVVSFMASFVQSLFPLDVLDGIWDLIESVSEGFLTYSFKKDIDNSNRSTTLFNFHQFRLLNAAQNLTNTIAVYSIHKEPIDSPF